MFISPVWVECDGGSSWAVAALSFGTRVLFLLRVYNHTHRLSPAVWFRKIEIAPILILWQFVLKPERPSHGIFALLFSKFLANLKKNNFRRISEQINGVIPV